MCHIIPTSHPARETPSPYRYTTSFSFFTLYPPHDLQYYMKVISCRWIGCESMCAISFQHLILTEKHLPHTVTQFLCLKPLPTSLDLQYYVEVISDPRIGCESMCAISFQHLILPERQPPHTGTQSLCLP